MTDLVNIWRTEIEDNQEWYFSYGNAANRNLLSSDLEADKLYFLMDTITRTKTMSELGGIGEVSFNGNFMLVIKSDLDNVYDNQKDQEYKDGKYEKNIRPIIETSLVAFEDYLNCSDYEITSWSFIDAVDILDVNLDGVIVTFTVKKL